MEKEIKDYLHLYLGCEVWYKEKLWDLVGVSKPYKTNETILVDVDLRPEGKGFRSISYISESFTDLSLIKPILRPLSDMTEEDPDFENKIFSPEQFLYLLSKHFDLFGLIESGLAIDATTLKENALI